MDYFAYSAILCCLCFLAFISTSYGEKNTVQFNERQVLRQQFSRRYTEHTLSKRSASNIVDIGMFTDSSAPGKAYSVYVDSTMTRLIVEVKVDRSNPVVILTKPGGIPASRPTLNGTASAGTVTATIDVAVTSADYGIWKLNKMDMSSWNVRIQAESSLDFTYQFLSGSSIQIPLTGDPIQGETYKTVITVADNTNFKSVDLVQIFVLDKVTPANMFPPKSNGNGIYTVDKLAMLEKDFMIGIQGRDKSGHFLRRIQLIKPIALLLSVPSFNDSSVKLYENTKLDLLFYVINKLSKQQDIDIRIQDTQGLAESPTILSATLTSGQNFTGKFTLDGGLFGVSTDVTITAKPYIPGKKTDGPSVKRTFTVERNITTTTSSSTTTSTTTSTATTTTTTSSTTSPIISTPSSTVRTTKKDTSSTASSANSFSAGSSISKSKPSGASSSPGSSNTPPGNSKSSTNSKTTASAGTHSKSPALSSVSKASTTVSSSENKDESFSKGEVFGAAIASGVSAGVLIGVAALVTMGLVFKHSINKSKRKVAPDEEKKRKKKNTLSEHNDLTKSSPSATTPTTSSSIFSTPAMVPIISSAPVSTKPETVSSSTTFVKNPVSAKRKSCTVPSTTAPSCSNPVSVDSKAVDSKPFGKQIVTIKTESNPDVVSPKDAPTSSRKPSTDEPDNNVPTEKADIDKSTDQSDHRIQSYLRLIKDLAKNKSE